MGIQEKILDYLSVHGKTNKYKISRELNIDVAQVITTFDSLQQEGSIKIKEGNAIFVKGKKPIAQKPVKPKKQPTVVAEEEQSIEEEGPSGEKAEEKAEEAKEETAEEITEEKVEEKRIEGTVKFFNPNKGFGFITGDDGKEYYVNERSLKEGVAIKADDRVSFKIVQETQGPKAEEVEKIDQSVEE